MKKMMTVNAVTDREETDDSSKHTLVNVMEEVVMMKAKSLIMYDSDICKCDKCFFNVCAIALNELSPRYYVSVKGDHYANAFKIEPADTMQVSVQIAHAIESVRKNPPH